MPLLPIPNSTRPPPMRMASPRYVTWMTRRRLPLRSNSMRSVRALGGLERSGRLRGARRAAEDPRDKDRQLVEGKQGKHFEQHRDRIDRWQERRQYGDHQHRVAPAATQTVRGDEAEPRG